MNIILTAIIAFVVSALVSPIIIPALKALKVGQSIREIGPSWHNSKSGTPTMGGIIFIIGLLVALLFQIKQIDTTLLLALLCSLGFGLVGFLDDYIKVVLKRNLGLRAWQKLALQIVVSLAFIFIGLHEGILSSSIRIPFTSITWDLGLLYVPAALFVLLAVVNGVNLTDGIDGLATSVTTVVMLFFTVVALTAPSLQLFCAGTAGGLLGFLLFNKYPAKVFMGDTGSLYLGGAVGAMALLLGNPLILIPVGFIYVCESLSVIIQVTSFKLTGKRVFKMSPIHHHFEMSGWKETKIVGVFTGITLLMCILSCFA